MKKNIYLKSIFLLFTLLAGVVSAHAEDYDYEWVKITNLDNVADGDVVLLVDESKGLAISKFGTYELRGVEMAVGDGKVSVPGKVTDSMKWTIGSKDGNSFSFKNNDEYLWGSYQSQSVSFNAPSSISDATDVFLMEDYNENGGKLCYEGATQVSPSIYKNYFCWSPNSPQSISIDNQTNDRFTLYKKGNRIDYVKWKRVDGLSGSITQPEVPLNSNDIVVVVDLKTGKAMSNDKGEKDPAGVAVTLNYDKDRIIMDEVPENVQWKYVWNSGNILTTIDGTQQLYTDADKGLKVAKISEINSDAISTFVFITNNNTFFPVFEIEGTDYQPTFDDGMFSNSWKLGKRADYDGEGIAIFKKVVSPQKVVKIELPEYYNVDKAAGTLTITPTITGADASSITWNSLNTDAPVNNSGVVTLNKRGSAVIEARVTEENQYHDKGSAACTVIIDDRTSVAPGSQWMPLTVAQAKELTEKGHVTVRDKTVDLEAGVNYYIKGKVSKVNSGMMAMFGDMDFGAMMGNMPGGTGEGMGNMNFEEEMDDMDFDMEDMAESGFEMPDFSSMGFDMSAFFGSSDKVSYYISDDGTKDNQMKVINGHGTVKSQSGGVLEFNDPDLTPGDWVVVCGPLVYTEDTNMFSSMMGNNDDEPKYSAKVDERNYLDEYDPTLLIKGEVPKEVYVNKSLNCGDLYEIDDEYKDTWVEGESGYQLRTLTKFPEGVKVQPATFKSSDEEIAKWDEATNTIVGVQEGKAKITVKVKVIVQEADSTANPKIEEKSYTMKRKFKIIVKTRDLDPAGYYDGEYVLTTNTDDLSEGTRLIFVGTRVKDDKETDYVMVENNAMMGGGKNGSKTVIEDTSKERIPRKDVPNGTLEVILEKADENGTSWYLNVGQDENSTPLYLYASDTSEENEEEEESGFDMKKMMNMFSSNSGLKVATMEEATADSCKATITFDGQIAYIQFTKTAGKNNTIMLSSSFDMEEMMNMFGGNKKEEENPEEPTGDNESTEEENTDMSNFDMFMASFNTKKPGDENAEEGKDPKCFMPRIYRFVPYDEFNISIGNTGWKTIVTYKDVDIPENVEAYVVTKVTPEDTRSMARLSPVERLKGGEPYLLHITPEYAGDHTLTLTTDTVPAPKTNLLRVSDRTVTGEQNNSTVYVFANKTKGIGFYRWTGGQLGAGRVYLNVTGLTAANAHEYVGFMDNDDEEEETVITAIQGIEGTESVTGVFYDLQGRRVNNPKKGVYIVNGKKVIIK